MRPEKLLWFVLSCCLATACESPQTSNAAAADGSALLNKHAKRFSMVKHADHMRLYVFGNRHNPGDTTATFAVYAGEIPSGADPGIVRLKAPCRKIAALSSIYASMLSDMGALDRLAAIDNIDYVNDQAILRKHSAGQLQELARNPDIDLEKTVALGPDVIFYYGMGDPRERNDKITATGIPLVTSVDHLEETPLARAEWIRFFAVFAGTTAAADSIFSAVEQEYARLRTLVLAAKEQPTVFSETKFGDVWYMPGGDSYMARFLKDAGASYLWADEHQSGSLPLSFEQVFAKAANASYWINQPLVRDKKELLAQESRYARFKAFAEDRLYNNTKHVNSKGYSTYWETGMYHPERILNDLIWIFHPELRTQVKNDLYYYRKLP